MSSPQHRAPFVRLATSTIHDLGVYSVKSFAPLDVILEVDDTCLDPRSATEVGPQHEARERYINHSCEPNAFIKAVDGVHYVFALRDIGSGEEITVDYAINRDSVDHLVTPCNCGSEYCRGDVHLGYFDLPVALQIAYLPLLEEWFISRHAARVTALCQDGLPA